MDKRIWRLSAAAFATCGLVAVLCYDWFRYHRLEHLSWAAALLAAIPVILGPLTKGWAAFNGSSPRRTSTPEELDLATRALSDAIGRQWRVEAVMRGLLGGEPMNLRWVELTHTGYPRQQNLKKKENLDIKHSRFYGVFSGGMESRVDHLARKFLSSGHRLVIVGAAGSGKTSLAILVLLRLLKNRNINDPVPVVLSLPDWDPREQDLYAWARSAILQEYPQLEAPAYGSTAIDGLVGGRRVLLVLDGLDELPTELQSLAIKGINRALSNDENVIITCRANQYRKLVNSGRNLMSSLTLELRPLECEDVRRFIEYRVPNRKADGVKFWTHCARGSADRSCRRCRVHSSCMPLWQPMVRGVMRRNSCLTGRLFLPSRMWRHTCWTHWSPPCMRIFQVKQASSAYPRIA